MIKWIDWWNERIVRNGTEGIDAMIAMNGNSEKDGKGINERVRNERNVWNERNVKNNRMTKNEGNNRKEMNEMMIRKELWER